MKNLFGYGTTNITPEVRETLKKCSPLTYVEPGLPPFLIVQGTADKTVPENQSLAFLQKLQAASVPCDLILIPEGQHRIADWAKFDPGWQGKVAAWLNEKLAGSQTPPQLH